MKDTIDLVSSRDPSFRKEVEELSGQDVSTCYQCGTCTASCPASFAYDLQANQVIRSVQLGLRKQVLSSESIWMCLSCSTCSLRCPNNIDVASVMETLRHMARSRKDLPTRRIDKFWHSFLDTVRKFGRSYEIGTMVLYMLRSGKLTTDVDLAPMALLKQKLGLQPHVTPHKGNEAVGRIFKRYIERAKREGNRP